MEEAEDVEEAEAEVECGMVSMSAGGEEVADCACCGCMMVAEVESSNAE